MWGVHLKVYRSSSVYNVPSCLENTTHLFSKIIISKSGVRGIYDIMNLGQQRDESNESAGYTYQPTNADIDEFV